jgi:DNA polymerase-3 subunit beta
MPGAEQVELTSSSGSYQMRGMPADDFPSFPLVENGTALRVDPCISAESLACNLVCQ